MSPGKWCDLGEQLGGNIDALGADIIDSAAEIDGVPMNDGADHQIEAGRTERLTVKGPVPDFADKVLVYGRSSYAAKLDKVYAYADPVTAERMKLGQV